MLTLTSICGFYLRLRLVKNLYVILIVLILILWLLSNHILTQIRGNGFCLNCIFSSAGYFPWWVLWNWNITYRIWVGLQQSHCTDAMTAFYYPVKEEKNNYVTVILSWCFQTWFICLIVVFVSFSKSIETVFPHMSRWRKSIHCCNPVYKLLS